MEEKNMAYYLEDLNRVHHLSFEKLGEWKEKYPYTQAVHFLMAKKHQLEGFIDDMSVYHKASFYAVDRTFLQERMTRSETEMGNIEIEEVVEEETVVEEVIVVEVQQEKMVEKVEVEELVHDDDEQLSDFAMWLNALDPQNADIDSQGQIKKKKKKKKHSKLKRKIEASIIKQDEIVSEPLALILAKQGHVEKAKLMYEKLSLIFPEKSSFFALQIEKLINSK